MIGSGIFLLPASLAPYGGLSLVGWLVSAAGAILLALVFAQALPVGSRCRWSVRVHARRVRRSRGLPRGVGLLDLDVVQPRRAGRGLRRLPRPVHSRHRSYAALGGNACRRHGVVADRGQYRGRAVCGADAAGHHSAQDTPAVRRRSGRSLLHHPFVSRTATDRPAHAVVSCSCSRDADALGFPWTRIRDRARGKHRRSRPHHSARDHRRNRPHRHHLHRQQRCGYGPAVARRAQQVNGAVRGCGTAPWRRAGGAGGGARCGVVLLRGAQRVGVARRPAADGGRPRRAVSRSLRTRVRRGARLLPACSSLACSRRC